MLPWGMDMDKIMSGRSMIRNRAIVPAFKAAGMIESFGTGIKKMQRLCVESGSPHPEIKEDGIDFIVTFFREQVKERTKNGTAETSVPDVVGMTGTESRVYAMICGEPTMTIKNISTSSGVSERSVKRALSSLTEKGFITRMGSDRSGKWVCK